MLVRWTRKAFQDLTNIAQSIQKENASAARKVSRTLFEVGNSLSDMPRRGRLGRIANTRELLFPGWPYILVYQISDEAVDILRTYHAAQDWP